MEWFTDYDKRYGLKADDTGAEEAEFIAKTLHLKKGDAVLDAPCGAGRIAACLARAGMRVTGVDLMPAYIQRARQRLERDGQAGRFIAADLRSIDFTEEFDGAVNWQGSFGFFDERDNLEVVRRYAHSLRPGGRLLIDQPSREWLLRHFRPNGRNGDVEFAACWQPDVERTVTTFRNVTTGESWSMTIRHYTPGQYRSLLRKAGLEPETFLGGMDMQPYRRGARRIYVVGRKPMK